MTTDTDPASASIRTSAAAELHELAADIRLQPVLVTDLIMTLLRIVQTPTREGVPIGPCEAVYYAHIRTIGILVLYTVDAHKRVTVEAFKKTAGS